MPKLNTSPFSIFIINKQIYFSYPFSYDNLRIRVFTVNRSLSTVKTRPFYCLLYSEGETAVIFLKFLTK
jgi:hypothetical protein